jgi:nucleoside transporter
MNPNIRLQLSIMMFLQFFVWGAWYVTAPNYLGSIGFTGPDFGWTYAVGPIAGMISPFFVGMIADRLFSAQRVLGILHLLGAAIMYLATRAMLSESPSPDQINWLFFAYQLTYFPTLALTNTVAMKNIPSVEKDFPSIRVLGTIGWIAAGLALTWAGIEKTVSMFYLAAGSAAALGFYSFLLPDTPPIKGGKVTAREILGLDALVLLKDRAYLTFIAASALICIPLAFYYQITSRIVELVDLPIGQTMSYGQMSEIFFMLVMPFFFVRLGIKKMLVVGMLAWVARYALFAMGAPDEIRWMIIAGVVLHGICYDFFFVTGQIYTDRVAAKPIRAQAQGLLVFFTLGLGMAIGAKIAGHYEAEYTTPESTAFKAQVEAKGKEIEAAKTTMGDGGSVSAKDNLAKLEKEKSALRHSELKAIDWKPLWGIPALMAGAVLVVFFLVFREPKVADEKNDSDEKTA